jgi:hypothetical protein
MVYYVPGGTGWLDPLISYHTPSLAERIQA